MMLVPRNRGMLPIRSALDDFFDLEGWKPHMVRGGYPRVNVHETDQEVIVTADIPGIDPKDIHIDVNDDMFTISGKIEDEKEEKDKKCLYQERFYGEFSRSFSLPTRVESDKVAAKFKNGTLSVHMPKASRSATKKVKIDVE
jgi:HSP20 family protein